MKDKVLLIDAYSIICRGFYALPLLSSNGHHTNAVLGFLNILAKTIDEEKPKYIAVAFDEHAPTFRHKLYKEYKGNRKGMEPELTEQVPYVKEILTSMNIKMFSKAGFEADDILGTLATKLSNKKVEAVILSGDRDMLQLATDDIKIRHVKTVKKDSNIVEYYAKDVEKELGVTPDEFIQMKALMGDSSDNIKGVSGCGKVTAQDLIVKYKSLDNIYKNIDEIKKAKLVENLKNEKEDAYLYLDLVTIRKDVPIDVDINDLVIEDLYNKDAYEVFKKYELKSLYKKFPKSITGAKTDEKSYESNNKKSNLSDLDLDDFNDDLFSDDIFEENVHDDNDKNIAYDLKKRIRIMDSDNSYDSKYKLSHKMDDLKVMSYINDPLKKNYDDIYKVDQKELFDKLKKSLEKKKLINIYEDIDLPLVEVLYNMEKIGVKVDTEVLEKYDKKLDKEIDVLVKDIYKLAGKEFNINSPKQLGEVLFTDLKLDYDRKPNEKQSTGIEVLEKLKDSHDIIEPIIKYRTISKLSSTYAKAIPKYIIKDRIHTNFNQTETATGRLSSDNPNLQNIPIRTELGREFRKIFVPRDGYVFVDADYSQIELRILAILSGDEKLISAYETALDVHSATASEVFNVPIDKVTPDLRRKAKAVNFGLIYGMSSYGLGEDLNIDPKEAKVYMDKYFATYKRVKEYLNQVVEDAKVNCYVRTYYGRIRPLPEFKNGRPMEKAFAKRAAMNSPIQGTAADIMKMAMINIDKLLDKNKLESRMVLQVHDEVLIEAKKSEVDKVKSILKEAMTDSFDFPVKLAIDIKEGKDFNECH